MMNINRKKKQIIKKRRQRVAVTIASFLMVSIITLNLNTVLAMESKKEISVQYISIEIDKGDTLWSIAKEYKQMEQSTASYIAELKHINNFGDDDIYEGNYLIVADYTL